MDTRPRSGVAAGALLILLGLAFFAYQFMPAWFNWLRIESSWPIIVIAVGIFLLIFGLLVGARGMAVPACVVSGIGLLLYWQNFTGDWASWSYAWTLIPGFVGTGIILAGLLGEGRLRDALMSGGWLVFISLVMFVIFGSFLGGLHLLGVYWPVLLILAGLILFVRAFFRR